jgi:hypothetical protein
MNVWKMGWMCCDVIAVFAGGPGQGTIPDNGTPPLISPAQHDHN